MEQCHLKTKRTLQLTHEKVSNNKRNKIIFVVNCIRKKEKNKYHKNLKLNKVTGNKTFWKTMKLFYMIREQL